MSSTVDRIKLGQDLLALIDRRRTETGDPFLGSAIEKVLIDTQLRELEADILEDPGAFEPWLVRRRAV
jgi:hypothetical protein